MAHRVYFLLCSVILVTTVVSGTPLKLTTNQPESDHGSRIIDECDHLKSFLCDDVCVPLHWKCDGSVDCSEGIDENGCIPINGDVTTIANQFSTAPVEDENEKEINLLTYETSVSPLTTPASSCDQTDGFKCNNTLCIPQVWVCNNDIDCEDGSDEEHCEAKRCRSTEFQCIGGTCIPLTWKCDRENDCFDNSDEENCTEITCSESEFLCKNNVRCITKRWICDGDLDCSDASDEENCTGCSKNQFACSDGLCIEESSRCDKMIDCSDGSDEGNCPESNIITVTESTLSTTQSLATNTPPLCTSCSADKQLYPCPAGYKMMKDKCIQIHIFPRRWLRANQLCHSLGGHLLVVNDNDGTRENLVQLLEETSLTGWNYWIDVLDSEAVKMTEHVVVIPSWFINGRTCEVSSKFPKYADNCYFLHYRDSLIYKGTNCNDNAGFICEKTSS